MFRITWIYAIAIGLIFSIVSEPGLANILPPQVKGFFQPENPVERVFFIRDNSHKQKGPAETSDYKEHGKSQIYAHLTTPLSEPKQFGHRRHGAPNPREDCDPKCEREKEDLDAQNRMATYTGWMLVATVAAVAAAVAGAILLYRDINVAREIGQKQTRAYVDVKRAELIEGSSSTTCIRIHVQNTGQSPAKWFEVASDIGKFPRGERTSIGSFSKAKFSRWPALVGGGEPLSVDQRTDGLLSLVREVHKSNATGRNITNNEYLFICGVVRYCDIYDVIFETEFYFIGHDLRCKNGVAKLSRSTSSLRTYEEVGKA